MYIKRILTAVFAGLLLASMTGCQKRSGENFAGDIKELTSLFGGTEESSLEESFPEEPFTEESSLAASSSAESASAESPSSESASAEPPSPESPSAETVPEEPIFSADFSFADVSGWRFRFSSGAGAWATLLTIEADGSFFGEYVDSDIDFTEAGEPCDMQYRCDFTGQFTEPVRVNDYTYSMQIDQIHYAEEPGTEEFKDGVRYHYTDVYGLEDAEDILIYLPGAPLKELPQEFRSWIGYYDLAGTSETELPFYALNNEVYQEGFTSRNLAAEVRELLEETEEKAEPLDKDMRENAFLTQLDLNQRTQDIYLLWDSLLNEIWRDLKELKSPEDMEKLTAEEREWISWKEEQIDLAGAEFAGGSMENMVRAQKAAELTRERVYVLMTFLVSH